MSAQTYDGLEDAIRAHAGDESETPGIVTDWYLIVAVMDPAADPASTNYLHVANDAPLHVLHGLVDLGHRRLLRDAGFRIGGNGGSDDDSG